MAGVAHFEYYERGFEIELTEAERARGVEQVPSEWRWRLRAANGEIVASGEGYASEGGVKDGVLAVVEAAMATVSVDPDKIPHPPSIERVES